MLETADQARRDGGSRLERAVGPEPLAPAVGILVGLALSVPLWIAVGGLAWAARAHMNPLVGAVLTWAAAFASRVS
jgi:hypothetical protein